MARHAWGTASSGLKMWCDLRPSRAALHPGPRSVFRAARDDQSLVGSAYNGYCLSIQSLPDGGLAWANETSCTVTNGCVTFTVDHATRFVANLTKASVPRPSITKLSSTSAKRGAIVTIQIVRVEALADRLLEGRPYQLD